MNLFQIISLVVVLAVLILLVRYAWGIFFDTNYRPVEWEHARRMGLIDSELDRLERNYPDKVRFYNWWFQVERLRREGVAGDFAELGVYKGESAKILHLMYPSRQFHLFDTFEGFKEEDLKNETGEAATYTAGNFADTSLDAVKRYLGDEEKFVYHVGRFQESSVISRQSSVDNINSADRLSQTNDQRLTTNDSLFALVNLDADLYNPTKAGLEFFYPRLSPGGIILIHDYTNKWPGIRAAVDEFVKTIPESPVFVPDMNGTVMIVKSVISQARPD